MENKQIDWRAELDKKLKEMEKKLNPEPEFEEILEKDISTFAGGKASHIILKAKHTGKTARVMIRPLKKEESDNNK